MRLKTSRAAILKSRAFLRELQSRFSKRHNEIDASIEKLLKEKPELAKGNLKELRSQIAQAERSRKIEGIALPELQRLWDSQLTGEERQSLRKLARQSKAAIQSPSVTAQAAIQWAEEHLFDRRSVVRENEIWSAALERGRGSELDGSGHQGGRAGTRLHPQRTRAVKNHDARDFKLRMGNRLPRPRWTGKIRGVQSAS